MLYDGEYIVTNEKGKEKIFTIKTMRADSNFAPGMRVVSDVTVRADRRYHNGFAFLYKENVISLWRRKITDEYKRWARLLVLVGKVMQVSTPCKITFRGENYRATFKGKGQRRMCQSRKKLVKQLTKNHDAIRKLLLESALLVKDGTIPELRANDTSWIAAMWVTLAANIGYLDILTMDTDESIKEVKNNGK